MTAGSCKIRGAGCGEMPTHKMQGKVPGLTPQFICTNTPWPYDDHKTGDTWAWDNRRYVMKHQLGYGYNAELRNA